MEKFLWNLTKFAKFRQFWALVKICSKLWNLFWTNCWNWQNIPEFGGKFKCGNKIIMKFLWIYRSASTPKNFSYEVSSETEIFHGIAFWVFYKKFWVIIFFPVFNQLKSDILNEKNLYWSCEDFALLHCLTLKKRHKMFRVEFLEWSHWYI